MLPHPDIGDTALDRQLFTYLEQPIALLLARLNYLQRYREELGNSTERDIVFEEAAQKMLNWTG